MKSNTIECIFSPVMGRYKALVIPAWVARPTLLPRQDDMDILAVRVSRRFEEEM